MPIAGSNGDLYYSIEERTPVPPTLQDQLDRLFIEAYELIDTVRNIQEHRTDLDRHYPGVVNNPYQLFDDLRLVIFYIGFDMTFIHRQAGPVPGYLPFMRGTSKLYRVLCNIFRNRDDLYNTYLGIFKDPLTCIDELITEFIETVDMIKPNDA